MKKLIRKLSLSRVTHSPHYSLLQPHHSAAANRHVPPGHFPVHVGIHVTRKFIVNAQLLRHPVFIELLNRSAQEYGYEQTGVIRIHVNVVVFERFLESLQLGIEVSCLDDVVKSVVVPPVEAVH